jgi:hypothetical protein
MDFALFLRKSRQETKLRQEIWEGDTSPPQMANLLDVVRRPKDYDGKRLSVTGFYRTRSGCSSMNDLHPSGIASDPTIDRKGIEIGGKSLLAASPAMEDLFASTNTWCRLEGVFQSYHWLADDAPEGFAGLLTLITDYEPISRSTEATSNKAIDGD